MDAQIDGPPMRTEHLRSRTACRASIEILPGQYFDAETGLHQNWHREYDPSIGRYMQSDPIGLAGGLSTYAYTLNNPLLFADPQGLYTGGVHRDMTRAGALSEGMSEAEARALGQGVVDADVGTQGTFDAHGHGMCLPAWSESIETCKERVREYIKWELAKCTKQGLANAIHATQDAQVHDYGRYYGSVGPVPLVGPIHGYRDAFPSDEQMTLGIGAARTLIRQQRQLCQCGVE